MNELFHNLNVLVLGNIRQQGIDVLNEFANVTVLPEPVEKSELLEEIGTVDAVLHKVGKIDLDIISRQNRVQIIARHGVGLDDLDLPAIERAGIPVSTTITANTNAVAEATIALTLNLLRHLNAAEAMIKRDRKWTRETFMGREINDSVVGILGFGRIGKLVAKYFGAFGADIRIHDAVPETLTDCPYQTVSLNELVSSADVLSLHCPLTKETENLIDAGRLSQMKETAILINTSRGGLVDKVALANAVKEGHIAGAGIDVFDTEPPDFDDEIFRCENIVTTPHIAAMTIEAQTAMAVGAAEEIRRVLIDKVAPSNNVFV